MGVIFAELDYQWMRHAMELAHEARASDEVPVGAVLVSDEGIILGRGANRPIADCDPSAHAEIVALRKGAKKKHNYRLVNTTLYVTLEPCLMCVGAIIHARVKRVVFGAYDTKGGAVASVFTMRSSDVFNHRVLFQGGLLAEECGRLLTDFFRSKR